MLVVEAIFHYHQLVLEGLQCKACKHAAEKTKAVAGIPDQPAPARGRKLAELASRLFKEDYFATSATTPGAHSSIVTRSSRSELIPRHR